MTVNIDVELDLEINDDIERMEDKIRDLEKTDLDLDSIVSGDFDDIDLDDLEAEVGLKRSADWHETMERIKSDLNSIDRRVTAKASIDYDTDGDDPPSERDGSGSVKETVEPFRMRGIASAEGGWGTSEINRLNARLKSIRETVDSAALHVASTYAGPWENSDIETIKRKLRNIRKTIDPEDEVNLGGGGETSSTSKSDSDDGDGSSRTGFSLTGLLPETERLEEMVIDDTDTPVNKIKYSLPETELNDIVDKKTKNRLSDEVLSGANSRQANRADRLSDMGGGTSRLRDMVPTPVSDQNRKIQDTRNQLDKMSNASGRLLNSLSKLRPTFRKVYAITATLLPAIVGLVAGAAALGTALATVAGGAGAVAALGLLGGEANTLAGSLTNAENKVKDFKQELFQAIQPAADQFAPITDRLMSSVVTGVRSLQDEIAALDAFTPSLFNFVPAATNMVEEVLDIATGLAPQLNALFIGATNFLSNAVPNFFEGVLKEGIEVAPLLAKIGSLLFAAGRLIYNLLKIVLQFVGALSALTPVLKFIANLLGNRWVQILILVLGYIGSMIGILSVLSSILGTVAGVVMALNWAMALHGGLLSYVASLWAGSWIRTGLAGIYSMIVGVGGLNTALGVTLALITAITGGLALLAAGGVTAGFANQIGDVMSPQQPQQSQGGFGGGGGGNDITMNMYGKQDNATRERMVDVTRDVMHSDSQTSGNFGG